MERTKWPFGVDIFVRMVICRVQDGWMAVVLWCHLSFDADGKKLSTTGPSSFYSQTPKTGQRSQSVPLGSSLYFCTPGREDFWQISIRVKVKITFSFNCSFCASFGSSTEEFLDAAGSHSASLSWHTAVHYPQRHVPGCQSQSKKADSENNTSSKKHSHSRF